MKEYSFLLSDIFQIFVNGGIKARGILLICSKDHICVVLLSRWLEISVCSW